MLPATKRVGSILHRRRVCVIYRVPPRSRRARAAAWPADRGEELPSWARNSARRASRSPWDQSCGFRQAVAAANWLTSVKVCAWMPAGAYAPTRVVSRSPCTRPVPTPLPNWSLMTLS